MKKLIILALLFWCSVGWAGQTESRTVYLSESELKTLNDGHSVYRWYGDGKPYGQGNEFMDEVRPPTVKKIGKRQKSITKNSNVLKT